MNMLILLSFIQTSFVWGMEDVEGLLPSSKEEEPVQSSIKNVSGFPLEGYDIKLYPVGPLGLPFPAKIVDEDGRLLRESVPIKALWYLRKKLKRYFPDVIRLSLFDDDPQVWVSFFQDLQQRVSQEKKLAFLVVQWSFAPDLRLAFSEKDLLNNSGMWSSPMARSSAHDIDYSRGKRSFLDYTSTLYEPHEKSFFYLLSGSFEHVYCVGRPNHSMITNTKKPSVTRIFSAGFLLEGVRKESISTELDTREFEAPSKPVSHHTEEEYLEDV